MIVVLNIIYKKSYFFKSQLNTRKVKILLPKKEIIFEIPEK